MITDKDLPLELDIAAELNELRENQTATNALLDKYSVFGREDVTKAVCNECDNLIDKGMKIEDRIAAKLIPIMDAYVKRRDFEGAKWFVGRSYKEVKSSGKVLLFRRLIIQEEQSKK